MAKEKKKGGRPSIKNPSYWLNQLPQFDPTLYQTEQQYHNVFKGTFPKTWEKVPGQIKKMVSDYYFAYGEAGSNEKRQDFQNTYQQPPAKTVPFKESPQAITTALQAAETELAITRNDIEPEINPDSFALAALEEQKKQEAAQRKQNLFSDLSGKPPVAKQTFQSQGPDPLKDAKFQPEDPGYDTRMDEAPDSKFKQTYERIAKQIFVYENIFKPGYGNQTREKDPTGANRKKAEEMINALKKQYEDITGEPGSYEKASKQFADLNPINKFNPQERAVLKTLGQNWNQNYSSNFIEGVTDGRRIRVEQVHGQGSLDPVVKKINEIMGGNYEWLGTNDRGVNNQEIPNSVPSTKSTAPPSPVKI